MTNYFGTDGIRARVGTEPMTPETITRLGWAVGTIIAQAHNNPSLPPKALIGKDTRISGYLFESALEVGLSAAGVDVYMLGPLPTPGVSYLTRALRANIGFVISASHNPHIDNGIKLFTAKGTKVSGSDEEKISALMDQPIQMADRLGQAHRISDATGRYAEFCKNTLASEFNFDGLHIALDCAHGASYSVAPRIFKELGAVVSVIGDSPDGTNINKGVGTMHPQALQDKVLTEGADIGIALDGDGDRVILIDHEGEIVDGDEILMILANHYQKIGTDIPGVVGTVMSNFGLEHALNKQGILFERSNVGDRYVLERLIKNGWKLGGETSGHIICLDKIATGDGIIAALAVIDALLVQGQKLAEAKKMMQKYPQEMVNIPTRVGIDLQAPALQEIQKQAETALASKGRVLIRPSGTEPVIRVMVEAQSEKECAHWVQAISAVVKNI